MLNNFKPEEVALGFGLVMVISISGGNRKQAWDISQVSLVKWASSGPASRKFVWPKPKKEKGKNMPAFFIRYKLWHKCKTKLAFSPKTTKRSKSKKHEEKKQTSPPNLKLKTLPNVSKGWNKSFDLEQRVWPGIQTNQDIFGIMLWFEKATLTPTPTVNV